VRTRRGLSRRLGMTEGLGFNPKQRGVREDHARVHRVRPGFFGQDDRWGPGVSDGGERDSVPVRG
jgi:hypothetical protein